MYRSPWFDKRSYNRNCLYKMVVTSWITSSYIKTFSVVLYCFENTRDTKILPLIDRFTLGQVSCIMFAGWQNSIPLFFHDLFPLMDRFLYENEETYLWPWKDGKTSNFNQVVYFQLESIQSHNLLINQNLVKS